MCAKGSALCAAVFRVGTWCLQATRAALLGTERRRIVRKAPAGIAFSYRKLRTTRALHGETEPTPKLAAIWGFTRSAGGYKGSGPSGSRTGDTHMVGGSSCMLFCGGTYVPVCAAANGHSFMIHSFAQWGKGLHRARRERSPHGRTPPAFSPPGVSLHHTDVHSSTFWSTRAHIYIYIYIFQKCAARVVCVCCVFG